MVAEEKKVLLFGEFEFDGGAKLLFRDSKRVDLTPKAAEILAVLLENAGSVVSKEELMRQVWPDSFVEEANLSHHVFKLRQALGDGPDLIETVPKRGYRFVGEVRPGSTVARGSSGRIWRVAAITAAVAAFITVGGIYFLRESSTTIEPQTSVEARTLSAIAVMPFVNESGDQNIEYLVDGITESVISRLSEIPTLRVRPRSTVYRYKDSEATAETIGKELGVASLLQGRMTKNGDSVRLFLSLIDVNTGYQSWGKQYDRRIESLAELQAEVIRDVAEYLPAKLSGEDTKRLLARSTPNGEAYIEYLRGRYQLNRKTDDGLRKSIDHFNEAVAIDPSFALAHAGLADAYSQMGLWVTLPPAESFPRAKAAAERSLALDEGLAEAHTALGIEKFYYEWDFAGAEAAFKRSIELNPNYALAREFHAIQIYESNPSRVVEARQELEAARNIDPLALSVEFWRGAFHYFEGENDEALRVLSAIQNLDPNFTLGLGLMGAVYREKGMYEEHIDHWLGASSLEGVNFTTSEKEQLRSQYRTGGLKAYAVGYAELLQHRAKDRYVSPIFVAMHYTVAGENEKAFEWLEKAYVDRSSWLVELQVDPVWKNLRPDPRFRNLCDRIGFSKR